MKLVEQFIEQHSWPTARKTLWLMGVVASFQVVVFPTAWLLIRHTGIVDMRWFTWLLVAGMAAAVAAVVDGWLALRQGGDGRRTAYVLVVTYGTFLQAAMYAFGVWSSFWLFFLPLTVFLCAVWYDAAITTFALFYSVALVTTSTTLGLTGVLPYAPALLDRDFDAQDSLPWVLGNGALFTAGLVVCFGLGLLAALGRDRQEKRLGAAFSLIRRYVPGQVADELLSAAGQEDQGYARRRLTVFFSDLVGFTDSSDSLEPEDLARVLNIYFAEMTTIAHRHGGTVDELSGDAILVLFGAPKATDDRDHALRAVRMAVEMQAAVAELNARWWSEGMADQLIVRIGINTGVVTVGNFGSPERMKYAALGKNVNVAARLQTHCQPGRILLSDTTWLLVRQEVECREVGEVLLKGLHRPVATYEVLVPDAEI